MSKCGIMKCCLWGWLSLVGVGIVVPSNIFASDESSPSTWVETDFDEFAVAGKPVSLLTGAENMKRIDLQLGQFFPITIKRTYHSNSAYDSPLGYGWGHSFDKRLYIYPDDGGSIVMMRKGAGQKRIFKSKLGYEAPQGETGVLSPNSEGSFSYVLKDGRREEYDQRGRLARIVDPRGSSLELSYEDIVRAPLEGLLPTNLDQSTPLIVAYDYRLSRIEEKDTSGALTGVFVDFVYDAATGRLIGLADSLGRSVSYSHDSIGNLTAVTTPKLSAEYGYDDLDRRHLLTLIDEGSGVYTNTYDSKGRVSRQTHALGYIDFSYLVPGQKTQITTHITNAAGVQLNVTRRTVEFDLKGRVASVIDTLGNKTLYVRDDIELSVRKEMYKANGDMVGTDWLYYDMRGNVLLKKEGFGAQQRTTSTTYHPVFGKVLTKTIKSVVDPTKEKVTTNAYDQTTGNLLSVTETGYLVGGSPYSYTTSYQYNPQGKMAQIDGPRSDVQDITGFGYDTAGNMITVTRPLIGTTSYGDFDGLGNPLTVTDPNGAVTNYTYNATGKVLTVKAPGDIQPTTYSYVSGGCTSCGGTTDRIDTIILPEGTLIDYDYDLYGNLSKISDSLGNSVNYSYDSVGNRLSEEIRDAQNLLQKSLTYQYDNLNHLYRVTNPDNSYSQYLYDSRGNRTSVKDPNTHETTYQYDSLSQLVATIQPGSITTSLDYDGHGNLSSVTDANNNVTSYTYDDMGRVAQVISPDTGTTSYVYDEAGNLKSRTDVRQQTTLYQYDAAGRLLKIDYPSDTDILFGHDTCLNGKGRLCSLTDQSGSTAYEYTPKGQIAKETKNILGVNYVTSYSYDMNGNVTDIVYPGNRTVSYAYTNNQVTAVKNNGSNVATGISYKPFGGITSFTYGNGLQRTQNYDTQYRITSIQSGGLQNHSYGFDNSGNIIAITNLLDNSKNKSYSYDSLDRLTAATGPWGNLGWTYDSVGNRQSYSEPTGTSSYSYQANSNRITGSSGVQSASYSLDANGNTIADTGKSYTYNQNNRLIQAAQNSTTLGSYSYNAQGQRVTKTAGGTTTVYHYDQSGLLIAETDAAGPVQAEYLYLNGQPLAKIEGGSTYYIHNDHLGTPMQMADSTGQKVWEIENRPFGDAPTISGTQSLNLRFPGQYYDAETGLNYNYFRFYSAKTGRYMEDDLVGILAGSNHLYNYARQNPMYYYDPRGLECAIIGTTFLRAWNVDLENRVPGPWVFDKIVQLNIGCVCMSHRDVRVDVSRRIYSSYLDKYLCTDSDNCGNETSYLKSEMRTDIELIDFSKNGGRETKREKSFMYSSPNGGGIESGSGCMCEPIERAPGITSGG